ncbi:MAG: SCO family protein [Balneolaceae bacterium]|nr:SCO family protein [Balneolaceae bacterium]
MMMPQFKFTVIFAAAVAVIWITLPGCDQLKVKDTFDEDETYVLLDQENREITFPDSFKGNVMLVSYVYTFCPDICPLITYNLRDIQRELPDVENFMLVSVSFDPDRDTPEILYDYANNYRLDQSNWRLLTGERRVVEDLLKKLRISTLKSPSRFTEDNKELYFIDHTDRITLIDADGNVRRHYPGSEMDHETVLRDIKQLLDEKNSSNL